MRRPNDHPYSPLTRGQTLTDVHIILATSQTHPSLTPSDALLRAELEARGGHVTVDPWDRIEHRSETARVVCLLSTWDYHHRREEFQRSVAGWNQAPSTLWNPPATVLWNLDKIYLRELADEGVRTPLTRWFEPGEPPEVERFLEQSGLEAAVVKPRVSATAFGMRLVKHGSHLPETAVGPLLTGGSMLQAFVTEVLDGGELSLVFIAGRFSHAVRKRPAVGDFRVQTDFGGTVTSHAATKAERQFGEDVLANAPHAWLYARVDIVETARGPVLMELEMIEPDLFLDKSATGAAWMADEIMRLARRP